MATRITYRSGGAATGPQYMDQTADHLKVMYDNSAIKLAPIAGTGNAVTATLDPVLDVGGLVDGMKFTLTWAAANSGPVTLAINGGTARAVRDAKGVALASGALSIGLRSLIEYIGGDFRILTALAADAGAAVPRYYQAFTASGTWTKPAGLDDDTMVWVEMWGGGGGGGDASPTQRQGGGGGGYIRIGIRLGSLPASVAVTVGAGGTGGIPSGTNGGASSFGAFGTVGGGQNGHGTSPGNSGTGGSAFGVAQNAENDSVFGGGRGGTNNSSGSRSIFGGGGGGGAITPAQGGISVYGGTGGTVQAGAGSAPGGGGAGGGNGARGEVRVWI